MKVKVLSIILTVCMIVGLLPTLALAETIIPIKDPDEPIIIKPFNPAPEAGEVSGTDLLTQMEQQIPEVPEDALLPYEKTEEPLVLVEKNELYMFTNGPAGAAIYTENADSGAQGALGLFSEGLKRLRFTKAVAFDPTGSGKRNHMAILGFYPASGNKNGAAYLYIINADTNTLVKSYELDKDWFGWIGELTTVDANNFFAITAGDYNGDGRDSLVVYCTTFRGDGSNALKEISYDGKNWSNPVYISVSRKGHELFNKTYMEKELYKSYALCNKLSVALESGDVNGDGIDDLVVVSTANKISDNYANDGAKTATHPMVAVAKGQKGTKNIGELSVQRYEPDTDTCMVTPDVSIGDINGDGINEVVVAGVYQVYHDLEPSDNGLVVYWVLNCEWTPTRISKEWVLSGDNGEVSAISMGDSIRADESNWQQFSTECVSLDGKGTKDYVFLNGYFYQWNDSSKKLVRASGSDALDQKSNQNDGNFAFNFLVTSCNGTDVNEVFIRSAAVGNFYGSDGGKEGISLIVGFKTNKDNKYFMKKIDIYKDDSGRWVLKGNAAGYLYFNQSVMDSIFAGDFLCPIDIGNDSVILRYRTTLSAYTDPNVVAFLQAAPYFYELGAGNSVTSYSYSESYTQSTSSGKEFSCGVGVSASFETPVLKTEVETSLTSNISEEFTESRTTEFTTTFEANDKNQVIIRRTLLYLYCYDLLTGFDENGEPVFDECGVTLSVPQYPVLMSLSMEQYDEFAQAYNEKYGAGSSGYPSYYLDLISKNDGALQKKYFLNNEGNPFAYATDVSKYANGFNMSQNNVWMGLSHSGGTSQLAYSTSVGTERSKTASDGVSVNLSVSVGSSFMGFGASVGVSSSLSSLRSRGVSTAQVTTTQTGGSVQNLDADRNNYGFDWQLIGWKTEPADSLFKDVPFVGYAVKNVSAPMAFVNDLKCTYTGNPSEVVLSWTAPPDQEGRIPARYFEAYRTDGGKREMIRGTNGTSFTYKCTDLTANFVVVAQDGEGKTRSADSNEVTAIFALTEPQVRALIEQTGGNLETAIADLKKAIEEGQAEAIEKAIADLTAAYKAADEVLKSELEGDLSDLEEKMQAAVDAVQASLDKAIEDLTKKIEEGDQANADALQKAVTELTAAYKAADEILKSELSGDMTALEEKLTAADAALQSAIDTVQANLDKAIANLTERMQAGDNENAEALQNAITELTAAYQAADDLLQAGIDDLSGKLAALEARLLKAEETLQAAIKTVQENLDKAVEDLTKAREAGDADTIARLNAAIDALTKAYKAADELLNSDIRKLETSTKEADEVLQANIDLLEQEIESLKSELQAFKDQVAAQDTKNAETVKTLANVNDTQQSELSTLKTVATVGLCISIASALGNIALLVLYLRKKAGVLTGTK